MHVIIYQRLKVLVCKQIKTNIDMNMTDCEVKIEIHYFVKEILSVLKWCVWYKTSIDMAENLELCQVIDRQLYKFLILLHFRQGFEKYKNLKKMF